MRLTVVQTPRRLARLPRNAPVLLRVISGSVRVSDSENDLYGGGGIPVSVSDGLQNWILPEGEFWAVADDANSVLEAILP